MAAQPDRLVVEGELGARYASAFEGVAEIAGSIIDRPAAGDADVQDAGQLLNIGPGSWTRPSRMNPDRPQALAGGES